MIYGSDAEIGEKQNVSPVAPTIVPEEKESTKRGRSNTPRNHNYAFCNKNKRDILAYQPPTVFKH